MIRAFKIVTCLLFAGLLFLPQGDAWAQAGVQDNSPRLSCGRGWLIFSAYSSGSIAGWNIGSGMTGEPDMMFYPGWNALPSGNSHSNYTRRNGTTIGQGIWVLSRSGATINMSWSGPRSKSEDIVDLVYDPSAGSEAALGQPTQWEQERGGSFMSVSNYWPGALVPAETAVEPPRKVWNWRPGKYTETTEADEIVISKYRVDRHGLTITRKLRTWTHQDFDDFILVDMEIENTGTSTADDVYIPIVATWSVSEFGERMISTRWWTQQDNSRDDWFKYTEAGNYVDGGAGGPVYVSASRAKGLKLSYQFDGNSPFTTYDDTGEPWVKDLEGSGQREMSVPNDQMTSFQFVGIAPVAYAASAGIHSFNAADAAAGYIEPTGDQPAYQNRWEIRGVADFDEPTAEGNTAAEVLDALMANAATDNPTDVGLWTNAQVYGPYTLAPGEKAKLVYTYVAGSGAEYGGPGAQPQDPWQWASDATKADLAQGEQAIVEHTEHALFAYQAGYDIPDCPPDVDFFIRSDENAKVKLMWSADVENAIHPDFGTANIAGYRIYRGLRGTLTAVGPFAVAADIPVGGPYPGGVTFNATGSWPLDGAETDATLRTNLQDNVDAGRGSDNPGVYGWSDPNSNAGFSYWYNVRAYTAAESDWQNASGTKTLADLPARAAKNVKIGMEGGYSNILQKAKGSPVLPYVAEADAMQRKVVVTPNPYFADGTHEYGGAIKIRFLNVPTKAFVYIFNTAGQLIQVLKKTAETRSEISWNGRPYSTIRAPVGPGIYFYAVEGKSGPSLGKIQTGTFVMIR